MLEPEWYERPGLAFVAALLVIALILYVACTPAPCSPADLELGELGELAEECEARVLRDCGRPPREDCPTLRECDRLGEERCR